MDKTSINLLTILIAGAGLFGALVKFYSPEVNYSFFGENPFLVKRDIIENTMSWIFTLLALSGLLFQAYKEIGGVKIKETIHSINFYLKLFSVGLVVMIIVVLSLTWVGSKIAKVKWMPRIIESQKEAFAAAQFIIEHDGWRQDQLQIKDKLENPEKYTRANFETAQRNILRIEKLLSIQNKDKTRKEHLEVLTKYFNQ